MDCGNNPCDFAPNLHGQRTQGRCRCWDELDRVPTHDMRRMIRSAVAEVRAAATERAVRAEAERDDYLDTIEAILLALGWDGTLESLDAAGTKPSDFARAALRKAKEESGGELAP